MDLPHTHLILLLLLVSTAWCEEEGDPGLGPRGVRPVEQGYKADKCVTEKEWPFCTTEEWGPKCPSGCRIQGLVDLADYQLQKKIDKIRKLLDENKAKYRSADQVSKQTYDYLKDKLSSISSGDDRYTTLAESLRQRIVEMKIKIDTQLQLLKALKGRVRNQLIDMQRLEVDIDIKLRACKGSCASSSDFSVERDVYMTLEKQLDQLEAASLQNVESVSSLRVMKSRPLKDLPSSTLHKSALHGDQSLTFFPDLVAVEMSLEAEGSSAASAVTVSKVPGGAHTSSSSSSSGGTTTVHCTKTVRKVTTHTKDGPVEKYEEVLTGGPACASAGSSKDFLKSSGGVGGGSISSLFPDLTTGFFEPSEPGTTFVHGGGTLDFAKTTGGSSSSGTVKTSSVSSSTKGGAVSEGGLDLEGFMRENNDDDFPELHARSVKTARVERQADYVGKDCVDIQQKHTSGEKSGLFKIKPGGMDKVLEVYCDQGELLGGWVLVQQRENGSLAFNRSWEAYKKGFGSVDGSGRGELWLGNKHLHRLTGATESILRVELEDWDGGWAIAEYTVRVGPEEEGYPLSVSGYTGDAGDALERGVATLGSFLSHAGMRFSTFDRDQDRWEENCAEMYGGGWWYNNCQSANLNGVYYRGGKYEVGNNSPYEIENGVVWLTHRPADYSLKTTRMKIKPVETA